MRGKFVWAKVFEQEDRIRRQSYESACFSMKPPADGWSLEYWQETLEPVFRRHRDEVRMELVENIVLGKMTHAEADVSALHEMWTRVADELGLTYVREEG